MIGLKAKLIAGAVLLALLTWSVIVVLGWRADAALKDKAVADLAAYGAAVEAREKEAAEERTRAQKRSEALSITLANVSADLEALRANPVVSIKWRTKEGEPCPVANIDGDWFRVRREAYDIASRAMQPAD